MDLKNIVGQEEITESIKQGILNDRIAHAYILSGPSGIGKKTLTGAFSALLLCEENGVEICGECKPCILNKNFTNPDYYIIEDDGSNSISVDAVRELMKDTAIRPLYSPKKVYVIESGEKMTVQAQNCLLKTLEEPPPYTIIIIITSNYESLLETIKSRCVHYSLKKNTPAQVKEFLREMCLCEEDDIDFIVSYSNGIIGKAIELAQSKEFSQFRNKLIEIVLELNNSGLVEVFNIYKYFEENKNHIDQLLDVMTLYYRDFLIGKKCRDENILINSDKKDIILSNAAKFSTDKIYQNIKVIEKTRRNLRHNANYQLAIEVMLMKLQEEYS